jgi:Ca2+-binding RTX toxin-like protein
MRRSRQFRPSLNDMTLEPKCLLSGATVQLQGVAVVITPVPNIPTTVTITTSVPNNQVDVAVNGVNNYFPLNPHTVSEVYMDGSAMTAGITWNNFTPITAVVYGGAGMNIFHGGSGTDEFVGGTGVNEFDAGPGYDLLNGGTGINIYNESTTGSGIIFEVGPPADNTVNVPHGATGTYQIYSSN